MGLWQSVEVRLWPLERVTEWVPVLQPVADSGCLRDKGTAAENNDAFVVKQFQMLVKIKIISKCDSDLKYNYYTSVIKTHRDLLIN